MAIEQGSGAMRIVIAGGGIAGLALALALKQGRGFFNHARRSGTGGCAPRR